MSININHLLLKLRLMYFWSLDEEPEFIKQKKRLRHIGINSYTSCFGSQNVVGIQTLEFYDSIGNFKQTACFGYKKYIFTSIEDLSDLIDNLYTVRMIMSLAVHLPHYKDFNLSAVWNPNINKIVLSNKWDKRYHIEVKVNFAVPNVVQKTLVYIEEQLKDLLDHTMV